MNNLIKSIKEKVPEPTLLDGYYLGKWGGYIIELKFKGKTYELETTEGVKGMNIDVIVKFKDGSMTFDLINS